MSAKVPEIIVHSPGQNRKAISSSNLMKPPASTKPLSSTSGTKRERLKQGHSMADWIRKIKAEPVKSISNRVITPDELRKHDKPEDGWMAIRGKVFDVTDYADFHPGGASYILKNLGVDATDAFDSIHAYVNFENILKGRQIGLYMGRTDNKSTRDSKGNKISFCCKFCKGSDQKNGNMPVTSFDQDDATITYKVECTAPCVYCLNKNENDWMVGINNKQEMTIRLVTKPPEIWLSQIKLMETLSKDALKITFENSFKKLIVTLEKPNNNKWKSIGNPVSKENDNIFLDSRQAPMDYYPAEIVLKENIGPSDILFGIRLGKEVHLGIPIAWHVKLRIGEIEKPYTPATLVSIQQENNYKYLKTAEGQHNQGQIIFFLIKIYEKGNFTPLLNKIPLNKLGDLELSSVRGHFDTDWLVDIDRLILIGGGTGIAPYVNIIKYLIHNNARTDTMKVQQIILIFSASNKVDLMWNETWEELQEKFKWFHYFPYTTRSSTTNLPNGQRITFDSVQENLQTIPVPVSKGATMTVKGCSCGPPGFTTTCQTIFEKLRVPTENIFVFEG